MTVRDLISIVNYVNINPEEKVRVLINFPEGTKEICDVLSYNTYTDGLVLNVGANKPDL